MSCFIIIREYKTSDGPYVGEVVRNAYLSLVQNAFYNALARELTFQLIVMMAAIMFIFIGVPLLYCILAVPLVTLMIFACIYSTFLIKSAEVMQTKRPLQCWVAEACQPFFSTANPQSVSYRIITEAKLTDQGIDVGNLQRKIVGTVSVSNFRMLEDSAWLFRLAVDESYRHKGIGHALVETVKNWSRNKRYKTVLLAMSECQDNARQLFISTGFHMKQMYHKHVVGSIITLLMYQLECDLKRPNF